jgi:hypothetical protein
VLIWPTEVGSKYPRSFAVSEFSRKLVFPIMQIIPQLTPAASCLWHIQVATLKWVKKHTTIPVAEVYAYDACPNNEVRGAYILQERVCDQEQLFSETNTEIIPASGSKT